MWASKRKIHSLLCFEFDKELEKYRDKHGYSVALLVNLYKAFDTINNDLLVAKLRASHEENSKKLKMSYLKKRYNRTKVESEPSAFEE